jgi:hypothetical protein
MRSFGSLAFALDSATMDLSHVFSWRRWRERFRSEEDVQHSALADGREPDATVDEVGSAPRGNHLGNGQGSGDPSSPGWAGWGGVG